jgi:DNA-binding NarL/FixJ family response regulator
MVMEERNGRARVDGQAHAASAAVRVLVVEDNGETRRQTRDRLAAGGVVVVGDVATVGEALTMARECQPAVALLDIALDIGTEGGLGLIGPFVELRIRCIVCSNYELPVWAARAEKYGAAGYLVKGVDTEGDLAAIVKRVAAGGSCWPPRIVERIAALPKLSKREEAALDELRAGTPPKQINAGYSAIRSLKEKLGVPHFINLLPEALRLGYHSLPDPIQEANARRRKSASPEVADLACDDKRGKPGDSPQPERPARSQAKSGRARRSRRPRA